MVVVELISSCIPDGVRCVDIIACLQSLLIYTLIHFALINSIRIQSFYMCIDICVSIFLYVYLIFVIHLIHVGVNSSYSGQRAWATTRTPPGLVYQTMQKRCFLPV